MKSAAFDKRPLIVALAGPNGAGKTTFYDSHLRHAALRYINADVLARELGLDPYVAADLANSLRRDFVKRGESFVFETFFSDPVGDKLGFLKEAAKTGCTVVLCFIGIAGPGLTEERVAMRISQGGPEWNHVGGHGHTQSIRISHKLPHLFNAYVADRYHESRRKRSDPMKPYSILNIEGV